MKEKYLVIWSLFVILFIGTFTVSLSYFETKINRGELKQTSFKTGNMNIKIVDSQLENIVLTPIYDKDYYKSAYKKEFVIKSSEDSLNSCASLYLDISEISEELKSEYLKYKLVGEDGTFEGNFRYADDVENMLLGDYIFIEGNHSYNYNLYIWISYDDEEDQMEMLNTKFKARVVVKSYDSENKNLCVNNN
jgi:hypothetical protein